MKVALSMVMKTLILSSIILLIGCAQPKNNSNKSQQEDIKTLAVCSTLPRCVQECEWHYPTTGTADPFLGAKNIDECNAMIVYKAIYNF